MAATETLPGVQENSAPKIERLDVTVGRDALLHELTALRGVVETKTTIPILANALLVASGDEQNFDERLSLTATCLDRTIETGLGAIVRGKGRATVPARKLLDYIKLLPSGDVKITEQDNGWLHIRSGRSNTKMVGMDAKNFPLVASYSGEAVALPAKTLAKMLEKVSFSIPDTETRYALQSAQLILSKNRITLVATDGHRLAEVKSPLTEDSVQERSVLIPGDAVDVLRSLLASYDGEMVPMGEDASALYFYIGEKTFIARKLSEGLKFPNYAAVLPKEDVPHVDLDPAATLSALRRAMTLSDAKTGAIALQLKDGELIFEAKSQDVGETQESLEILGGTEMRVGFNGVYVRQFLELAEGPIALYLKDPQSAVLFLERFDDGMEYRYVVMPMRIA